MKDEWKFLKKNAISQNVQYKGFMDAPPCQPDDDEELIEPDGEESEADDEEDEFDDDDDTEEDDEIDEEEA